MLIDKDRPVIRMKEVGTAEAEVVVIPRNALTNATK